MIRPTYIPPTDLLDFLPGEWSSQTSTCGDISRLVISRQEDELQVNAWIGADSDLGSWPLALPDRLFPVRFRGSAFAIARIAGETEHRTLIVQAGESDSQLRVTLVSQSANPAEPETSVQEVVFERAAAVGMSGCSYCNDCLQYRPVSLRIVDEGARGWLLTDGSDRILMLDNEDDARAALALARGHTHHCFIGRDNSRADRSRYIVEFWMGDSGLDSPPPTSDCIRYRRDSLRIVNEGDRGWLLTDGSDRMLMLANENDARAALELASLHNAMCFIGRGNQRSNRSDYIVLYWQ
jgi:hypothetical protein